MPRPLITIFNGRVRSLGKGSRDEIYVQVQVALRGLLHHFKGARLSVFMCVALHIDADGWSSPSIDLIRKETGYTRDTVCDTIAALCKLEIAGGRVMLRSKGRSPGGTFDYNRYLIFPSKKDLAALGKTPRRKKPDPVKSRQGKTATQSKASPKKEPPTKKSHAQGRRRPKTAEDLRRLFPLTSARRRWVEQNQPTIGRIVQLEYERMLAWCADPERHPREPVIVPTERRFQNWMRKAAEIQAERAERKVQTAPPPVRRRAERSRSALAEWEAAGGGK